LLNSIDGTVPGSNHALYHFMYPSYRVNHFVPRTHPQKEIRKHFQAPQTTIMPTVVVLLGMGGCGKSQLALEYCQQSENDKSYSAIFWIDAMSQTTIEQGLTALARELSKPGFDVADTEGNIRFVLTTISTWQERWMLVFDNFDDPHSFGSKSIKDYFPRSSKGSVLVTSRDGAARGLGYHVDISTMSNEEALELLFRRSESTRNDANLLEAHRIIKRLGFHALAIDQAGAYIQARTLDLDLFLEHYNKRREEVLNETPGLWDYKRKLSTTPEIEAKLTVFTTWELSFDLISGDQITRDDKEHLLTLIAFFDKNEISDTLFKLYSSRDSQWMTSCTRDNAWDEYKFQDILKELRNLSLVQSLRVQSSGTLFSLHPLVQDWIKLRISSESRRDYIIEATLVLSNFIKTQVFHEMAFNTRQTTFSHLEAILQNDQEYLSQQGRVWDTIVLDATSQFATFLNSLARYEAAEELFRRVFKGRESLLGKEHPDTLGSMNNLAKLLQSRGKYNEAEPIYRQTLALREKVLGKEHPDTLGSINNLALLLDSQGKCDEAEPICRETLALTTKILGKEHPDTLGRINNLAKLLGSQGKHNEAEPICRQTLALIKKVLGKEHPDTLISMNNLATMLRSQGKYSEAEPICRQTLALMEKVLGKEHPHTLNSISNLAILLQIWGKYNEAEPICQQTLALREKVLGKEHPDTLISINNLAALFRSQGKHDKAEKMYERALQGREKALGPEHTSTLFTVNSLGNLYRNQGKLSEAEKMYERALQGYEKVLGPEHISTLGTVNSLGNLYRNQGKLSEAEKMYERALQGYEKALGHEHVNTYIPALNTAQNFAMLYVEIGRADKAEDMYSRALSGLEVVFGRSSKRCQDIIAALAALNSDRR
jgi:tetratricopeptide (TPR) repeat protein